MSLAFAASAQTKAERVTQSYQAEISFRFHLKKSRPHISASEYPAFRMRATLTFDSHGLPLTITVHRERRALGKRVYPGGVFC